MPIYEYKDLVTGQVVEIFHFMKDPPLTTCPDTGHPLQKLISMPAGIIIDSKQPKTVRELADKNTKQMINEGKLPPPKKKQNPFWRKDKDKPLNTAGWTAKEKMNYIKTGKKK